MSKDIDKTVRMTPETLQSYIEKARDEGFEKAWKQAGHLDLDLRQRDVQIAELKAENARYREALDFIVEGRISATSIKHDYIDQAYQEIAREALKDNKNNKEEE